MWSGARAKVIHLDQEDKTGGKPESYMCDQEKQRPLNELGSQPDVKQKGNPEASRVLKEKYG